MGDSLAPGSLDTPAQPSGLQLWEEWDVAVKGYSGLLLSFEYV